MTTELPGRSWLAHACDGHVNWRKWVPALAIALALVSVGDARAQGASLVRVDQVTEVPISQTVPVIGRLVARQSGDVAARISGALRSFEVEVGDRVEAGQIIAVLDTDALQAELELAESALAEADAQLATTRAEAELARRKLQRQKKLRKSAAFSKVRYEDAELAIAIALSKIRSAEARMATRKFAIKRRTIDVKHGVITAPYEGVVVRRYAEIGGYVRNGQPLVKLIGDRTLEIEVDVPANRLAGLLPGREVAVTLDDGTHHVAVVRALLPSENALTRTRTARLRPHLTETRRRLAENQSVTVEVPIGAPRDVIAVHKDAILKRQGNDIVYVVKDEIAKPRPITLGESIGERIEVVNGLAAGEIVVVRGNERLRPGAKVRIDKSAS